MAITVSTPLNAEALFDSIGPAYESAFADCIPQQASIDWLLEHLPPQASVLDIGCGTGRPVCSSLTEAGHDVLGIDVSSIMIAAATRNVTDALFKKIDIKDFKPADGKRYDAITVYFSLIASVTQQQIRDYITQIHTWLKEDGFFIFATVPMSGENQGIKWMGRDILASSLSSEEVLETMNAAKFVILKTENSKYLPKAAEAGICRKEEVWEENHLFVYARK